MLLRRCCDSRQEAVSQDSRSCRSSGIHQHLFSPLFHHPIFCLHLPLFAAFVGGRAEGGGRGWCFSRCLSFLHQTLAPLFIKAFVHAAINVLFLLISNFLDYYPITLLAVLQPHCEVMTFLKGGEPRNNSPKQSSH